MKIIGLIGGMSWHSTIEYYRILNETASHMCGDSESARIILYSVDFQYIIKLQKQGAWEEAGQYLAQAAHSLEAAGAELLLIGAVTMHKVAQAIQDAVGIPLLHIVDVTASKLKAVGIKKIGLLGTQYTMEDHFFIDRLALLGIEAIVPIESQRVDLQRIIFEELTLGIKNVQSKKRMLEIIDHLTDAGAQGAILGCTELSLLVSQKDIKLPVFDTTYIHATYAIESSLKMR
jgi:aspartate racemase